MSNDPLFYHDYIQANIDGIISTGNILPDLFNLSQCFNSGITIYTGTDNKPHEIIFSVYITQNGTGYLPTGVKSSYIFSGDDTQIPYSMNMLLAYASAYDALYSFGTPHNLTEVQLPLPNFTQFTSAYNTVVSYYNTMSAIPNYDVKLYSTTINSSLMITSLDNIKNILFPPSSPSPNFTTYYNNFVSNFNQTINYQVNIAIYSMYILSGNSAAEARKGQIDRRKKR